MFGLVYWCLTALSAQTGYIVPQGVWCWAGGQDKYTIKQWNNTLNQENHKHSLASAYVSALWRRSPCHN